MTMYISLRGAFIRNVVAAMINCAITLVLLLIAPLGLASVIFNTLAVALSTFFVCMAADFVVAWLLAPSKGSSLPRSQQQGIIQRDPYKQEQRRGQNW